MNELGRESRALIAAARHGDRMRADDKARIRGNIGRRLGTGIALGSALTASATAAEAARASILANLTAWLPASAKLMGIVLVSSAVGVATMRVSRPAATAVSTTASVTQPARAVPLEGAPLASLRPTTEAVPAALPETAPAVGPAPSLADRTRQHGGAAVGTSDARSERLTPKAIDEPAPAPTSDLLGRQVAAIRESRAAIRRGDAQAALSALDRAAIEGQAGPLEQESMLARLSALCLQGNVGAARRLSEDFLVRFPTSLLVPRIRASCAFDSQ